MSGRPAARCSSARCKSLAEGMSPDKRMRPAWLLIGEAARAKAGFRSTSAKSSRTKGRITLRLYQRIAGSKFLGMGQFDLTRSSDREAGTREITHMSRWSRLLNPDQAPSELIT